MSKTSLLFYSKDVYNENIANSKPKLNEKFRNFKFLSVSALLIGHHTLSYFFTLF